MREVEANSKLIGGGKMREPSDNLRSFFRRLQTLVESSADMA